MSVPCSASTVPNRLHQRRPGRTLRRLVHLLGLVAILALWIGSASPAEPPPATASGAANPPDRSIEILKRAADLERGGDLREAPSMLSGLARASLPDVVLA